MTDFVELVYRCSSWQQADQISNHLLTKRLISRAEVMTAKDINLLMTTMSKYSSQIETEIQQLLHLSAVSLHTIPLARFNHYTISGTGALL